MVFLFSRRFLASAACSAAVTLAMAADPASTAAPADSVPTYTTLDDVVVEAKKALVQNDGAKLTYNTESDPTASTGSVIDLLRKVPSVTVTGDDQVMVNGNGNFRWQINGKDAPMLQSNAKDVLKAMPAASVAKIEVIRDPGAKYDAEGAAGILNIVLQQQKQMQDGYAGRIGAQLSPQDYALTGNVTAKRDKFTVATNLSYGATSFLKPRQTVTYTTDYLATGQQLREYGDLKQSYTYGQANVDMSWQLNAKNLFTGGFTGALTDALISPYNMRSEMYASDGSLLWSVSRLGRAPVLSYQGTANAGYQHNFNAKGHNLVLSYLFSYGQKNFHFRQWADKTSGDVADQQLAYSTKTDNYNREHTAQLDYTNPLGDGNHTIEVGAKSIFRHNSGFGENMTGASLEDMVAIASPSDDVMQMQNVYAAYASYTGVYGNLSTRVGVRDEYTYTGMDYRLAPTRNFRTHYNDVVPNASVAYNFDAASNLRLAYLMRISRPSLEQLTPFATMASTYEYKVGNQNLSSEQINRLELSFSKYARLLGGTVNVNVEQSDNQIAEVHYLKDGIRYQSFDNIGHKRGVGIGGQLMWQPIQGMSVSLSGDGKYVSLDAPMLSKRTTGFGANVNAYASYMTPSNWHFSAYGGYGKSEPSLQASGVTWTYHGLGATKYFLNKTLQLTLNLTNIFTPTQTFVTDTEVKDAFSTHNVYKSHQSWRANIGLAWTFGNLREQVKKTDRSIQNTDLYKAAEKKF